MTADCDSNRLIRRIPLRTSRSTPHPLDDEDPIVAKAKSQKNERQAKIDAIRGQQQSAERRRGLMIVGVCVVVALLIIAFPVYSILKDRQEL